MPNKNLKVYRSLFRFTSQEASELFERIAFFKKQHGIDIRIALKENSYARLLIIIGKQAGIAAQRNLLRRRIKEIFYRKKLYNNPFDGIVIIYKEAQRLSFKELETIISKVFA